jgi:class 3 adenylate cyclase/tetratricopeptide (TPR) repeat protein/ribosomal protein L40E
MRCPNCSHENPEAALFCMKCGTRLQKVCPKCEAQLPPDALFCMRCGAKLSDQPPAKPEIPKLEDVKDRLYIPAPLAERMRAAAEEMEGENRLVTALFADISGFTDLSSRYSPEQVVQVVNDCFKVIVDTVLRYEGSINRFIGDNVLAFFGAPIMHENDPERAILAALEMRDKVGELSLQISIGINSGMMYFGPIGTTEHLEISAYGPEINLAKRLEEAAEPGQILVGPGTYRLTKRAFVFSQIPDLHLKGMSDPVTAYEVIRVRERPEKLRGIEGLRSRMIGREREFAELADAAQRWLSGQGGMVSIIGEAGIGKSRLVTELKKYLHDTVSQSLCLPLILEGRCISIGQPISYWPFIDMFRTLFELREEDDEREVAEKIREGITKLFPQRWQEILPFVGHLMSIRFGDDLDRRLDHFSAEQIRHQTMMRLRDIFVALAREKPLMLILEDLHWADDLSLDLISLLMDELVTSQMMLICVYRPEREHRCWQLSALAQRKCFEHYTEIRLQKLTQHQSRQLIRNLLAIDNLPESVRAMILRKSEGNPFFIEEVIRSLIDRGLVYREGDRWKARDEISEIDVPDTIQSVIMARIDRLEAETKYVLQCASVIGRLFRYRLLGHLVRRERELDRYLEELEEKELVYEERSVPELEYAFKHALTQEATYQSILEQRRRAFHRQVAEGIERLYRERIEEFYEELAHHWEKSGNKEKTLEYLVKAGAKAARNYAGETAIDYYTRAIQLAEGLGVTGDELAEIYEARSELYADVLYYEESIADALKAVELSSRRIMQAKLYQHIAKIYDWYIGDIGEAMRYALKTIEILDPSDKSRETSISYAGAGIVFLEHVDVDEGERHLKKAIEISEEMGYKDLLAEHYTLLGYLYSNRSKTKWLQAWEKAIACLPYLKKSNLKDYSLACAILGGEEFYREGLDAGLKSGVTWSTIICARHLGAIYQRRGELRRAIEVYEQGWQIGVRRRFLYGHSLVWIGKNLIKLYTSRGERSKLIEMMLQMVDSTKALYAKPEVYPTVRRKWNNIVEEIYREFLSATPEIYEELKMIFKSHLGEAENPSERFFYLSQLLSLALIEENWEEAETYAHNMIPLRSRAGSFTERTSLTVHYAPDLIIASPDRRRELIARWVSSAEQFEELREILDALRYISPVNEIAEAIDWDYVDQLALEDLRWREGFLILLRWIPIRLLYNAYGGWDRLSSLAQQVWETKSEELRKDRTTHLLLEPVSMDYLGELVLHDDFSEAPVSKGWEWIDPLDDSTFTLNPTSGLEIEVPPKHDLWSRGNLNAPRLLQPISGDFIIETKLSDGCGGKKFGGLLAWKDKDSYARFDVAGSSVWYAGCVYYGCSVEGRFIHPGVHPFDEDPVWLRLERRGNRFTGYVSSDRESWYCCGWADIPMGDLIKVGIHALCPQSPTTSTRFEYFKVYKVDV